MRWMILTLMLLFTCIGCGGQNNPTGMTSPDGGWNAREKNVPGVKTYYGAKTDDDN